MLLLLTPHVQGFSPLYLTHLISSSLYLPDRCLSDSNPPDPQLRLKTQKSQKAGLCRHDESTLDKSRYVRTFCFHSTIDRTIAGCSDLNNQPVGSTAPLFNQTSSDSYCRGFTRLTFRAIVNGLVFISKQKDQTSSYPALHHVADPLLHGLPSFRSDQNVDGFDLGTRPQQLLHQHFSHETRGSCDEDALACVVFWYGRHSADVFLTARPLLC